MRLICESILQVFGTTAPAFLCWTSKSSSRENKPDQKVNQLVEPLPIPTHTDLILLKKNLSCMTSLLPLRPELIRFWVTRLTFLPHPLLLSFFSRFGDMAIAFNMPLTFLSHFHWLLSSSCGCPGLSLGVNVVSSPPALPPPLHQGSRGAWGWVDE